MPEQLWFTEILNHLFAAPVAGLLQALHIHPQNPEAPITNAVAMEVLVFLILIILFALVRSRLSVDEPGALQHVFEGAHSFIEGQSRDIIGPHSEGYTAFLVALGLFILTSNLLGVIPGFESPTADKVVPLGCAICAFVYYQTQGFKHAGVAYLKHFLGPIWWLSWLMVLIEIVSHLARVLSLTLRL
ncbi:MAG: F0F1 ATP synthase subunit A, partial [Acidobacteria bacterium]